jgi:predicted PurR-regulated permease PerM
MIISGLTFQQLNLCAKSVVNLVVITIYLYNFLCPSIKLPQKVFESLTEEERNRFWQAFAEIYAELKIY